MSLRAEDLPTPAEVVEQAVNADVVRIITNRPPRSLTAAMKWFGFRRWMAATSRVFLATGFLLGLASMGTAPAFPVSLALLLIALVALGFELAALLGEARTAQATREELLIRYGVAPNDDGVFELVREGPPHADLAATREALRVYGLSAADASGWPRAGRLKA